MGRPVYIYGVSHRGGVPTQPSTWLGSGGTRAWCAPLQCRAFTPELQWRSRGKRRISQGCQRENLGLGHSAIVWKLLARGASANQATPNGTTPFLLAAQNGHTDVFSLILTAPSVDLEAVLSSNGRSLTGAI